MRRQPRAPLQRPRSQQPAPPPCAGMDSEVQQPPPHARIQCFGSIVFAQIRYLVVNLNKKNQKSSTSELAQLIGLYGESALVYMLRCLIEEIDFRDAKLQKAA